MLQRIQPPVSQPRRIGVVINRHHPTLLAQLVERRTIFLVQLQHNPFWICHPSRSGGSAAAFVFVVARSFVVIPQRSGGTAAAFAFVVACSFVVIPQRSGGICCYNL